MGENSEKFVFVSNELGNFRCHREHLVRAVQAAGGTPILLAAPVGDTQGLDYDYRPLLIERFRLHFMLDARLFVTVLKLLLKERPRIIHLISIKPYLFGGLAARIARLLGWTGRVVITVPGLGRLYDQHAQTLAAKAQRCLVEKFLRTGTRHARVSFETKYDRDFWIARGLISQDQAMVTHGSGIDLTRFIPKSRGQTGDRLKVLFAGRLLRAKGLDVFLRAAELMNDPEIEMQVAGFVENDPDAVPLDTLRRSERVKFLGAVSDMPGLLNATDIVALPSRYNEGVPRILTEAAASGCILIATRFAGSEMLIEDGRTGYFLDAGDKNSQAVQLAALIRQVKKNRFQNHKLGENAVAHVHANGFSDREVTAAFLGLYASE